MKCSLETAVIVGAKAQRDLTVSIKDAEHQQKVKEIFEEIEKARELPRDRQIQLSDLISTMILSEKVAYIWQQAIDVIEQALKSKLGGKDATRL